MDHVRPTRWDGDVSLHRHRGFHAAPPPARRRLRGGRWRAMTGSSAPRARSNHGHEIDAQGDAHFLVFAQARDAVAAAAQMQRGLAAEAWPAESDLRVRVGLHTGDAARSDGRYVGLSIHRAARICAAAHGGQVLLSSATREILADDVPAAISFRDLGRSRLKDFDRPERLFQLVGPGLDRDFARVSAPAARGSPPRTRAAVAAAVVAIAATAAGIVLLTAGGSGRTTADAVVDADSVGVVDPGNGRLLAQPATGASPSRVVAGRDAVWVTNADGGSVSRTRPRHPAVRQTITVGGTPAGIALADGAAWVADTAHGKVVRDLDGHEPRGAAGHRSGIDPTGVAAAAGRRLGRELRCAIDPADRPCHRQRRCADRRRRGPDRRGRRRRRTVGDERARPDAVPRRSAHRAGSSRPPMSAAAPRASRSPPARCGSRTSSTARCPASIPRPGACGRPSRSATGPARSRPHPAASG